MYTHDSQNVYTHGVILNRSSHGVILSECVYTRCYSLTECVTHGVIHRQNWYTLVLPITESYATMLFITDVYTHGVIIEMCNTRCFHNVVCYVFITMCIHNVIHNRMCIMLFITDCDYTRCYITGMCIHTVMAITECVYTRFNNRITHGVIWWLIELINKELNSSSLIEMHF